MFEKSPVGAIAALTRASVVGSILPLALVACSPTPLVPPARPPDVTASRIVVLPTEVRLTGTFSEPPPMLAARVSNGIAGALAERGYRVRALAAEEVKRADVAASLVGLAQGLVSASATPSWTLSPYSAPLVATLGADLLVVTRLTARDGALSGAGAQITSAAVLGTVGYALAATQARTATLDVWFVGAANGAVLWQRTDSTPAELAEIGLDAVVAPLFVRFPQAGGAMSPLGPSISRR